LADLAAQLATAKKEAADNYDRFMRTAADLENLRKRTLREKEELRLYSASRVLEDLLPVMDNLALGLTAAKQPNADLKTLTGGVDMVLTQFKSALGNHGLKEIHPAGLPFDPHQHEALSHAPSPEVKAEHVLNVIRTGYSLNGRLLPFGWARVARLMLTGRSRTGRLPVIGIAPAWRHHPAGAMALGLLLQGCIAAARARGWQELEISWVLPQNLAMQQTCDRLGAPETGRWRLWQTALAST
jgi:molecular chaperone GrpE (heat shock protein)